MWIKDGSTIIVRKFPGHFPDKSYVDDIKKVYDLDTGELLLTKDTITVTWEQVDINWFAEQHILKSYPLWKQSNITREGGSALTTMTTFIDAVRAWSNQDPMPDPWDGSLEAIT